MQLITNPIYVLPDGCNISLYEAGHGIICLDANHLTIEALQQSLRCWSTDEAIESLASLEREKLHPMEYTRLLQSHIALPNHEEYMRFVQDDRSKARIAAYTQSRLDAIKQDPQGFFDRMQEAIREHVAEIKKYGNDELFRFSTSEELAYQKECLTQAIALLPDYLQTLLEHEDMLFICGQMRGASHGFASYSSRAVFINRMQVDYCNDPSELVGLLKEEFLHYFDAQLGASKSARFREAADRLRSDGAKSEALQQQLDIAHGRRGKTPLLQYKNDHYYAELLAEYFHLREHLQATQPETAEAQLKEAFGLILSAECRAFEDTLKAKAAALGEKGAASVHARR